MDEACPADSLIINSPPFLPCADKAIDLVDEACSNLQVQLESKPEAIDVLERQLIRLQVGGWECRWVGGLGSFMSERCQSGSSSVCR